MRYDDAPLEQRVFFAGGDKHHANDNAHELVRSPVLEAKLHYLDVSSFSSPQVNVPENIEYRKL